MRKDDSLRDYLEYHNIPLEHSEFLAISEAVELEAPMDFFDLGYKWTRLERKADGSVTAFSLKPFNLLRTNPRTFRKKLLATMARALVLISATKALGVVASFILIILDFDDLLYQQYTEDKAKVLLAVFFTNGRLNLYTVGETYQQFIKEEIGENELAAGLQFLVNARIMQHLEDGEFVLNETISFHRAS